MRVCRYGERGWRGVQDLLPKEVRENDGRDGEDGSTCGEVCEASRYSGIRMVGVLVGIRLEIRQTAYPEPSGM